MQTPNENGVYQPDMTEELAREGRAYVELELCQCEDGLFRYALSLRYSYGGFSGPISAAAPGFASIAAAKESALAELLRRFPRAWPSEPQSVHEELRRLRARIEQRDRQLTLF